MEKKEGAAIIVFSGDMDKIFAAFTIATGSASTGKQTSMFFTFWGLKAIQKGGFTGNGFFARLMSIMNRGGINRIGPSRFNFWGIGRWMFKKMMKNHNIARLEELRQMAIDLGVKLQPCLTSMEVMEIKREDLIDEAEEPCGVATMLEQAFHAGATFFI